MQIFVVEDDLDISNLIVAALSDAGHSVTAYFDGREALIATEQSMPDLMVLDWMIPSVSGIDVCKRLKSTTPELQIIMLSARGDTDYRVLGLDAGADDYMSKPFSARELVSRVNAIARRLNIKNNQTIQFGTVCIDLSAQLVTVNNQPIKIGPTELKLLIFFAQNQNKAFNREQILNNVWGTNVYIDDRTVDVHIGRLRKILTDLDLSDYIQTVRGIGYRFQVN